MPKRAFIALLVLTALASAATLAQAPVQKPAQAAAAEPAKAEKWTDATLKQESYATPPKELVDAVLAPRYRNVALTNASPDKKWFLDEVGDGPVTMAVFSKPFHELGGLFVDYQANRARPLTIRNNAGLQVISAVDGSVKPIQLPAGARISNAAWSPDSALIAFYVHTPDATHIWVADPATGASKPLTPKPVLATLVSSFDFSADGKRIATVLVPDGRAPMPKAPASPSGPQVKVADDADKNRLRTFPSLMATPHDFELLEWHATGQVAVLDVTPPAPAPNKGRAPKQVPAAMKKIGGPQLVRSLDLSPDGKYLRVTRVTKPFSYVVPVSNFGSVDEVWDSRRQGDGRARQAAAQRRRAGRHAAAARPGGGPGRRAGAAAGPARAGVARRRPGPDVPRTGTAAFAAGAG